MSMELKQSCGSASFRVQRRKLTKASAIPSDVSIAHTKTDAQYWIHFARLAYNRSNLASPFAHLGHLPGDFQSMVRNPQLLYRYTSVRSIYSLKKPGNTGLLTLAFYNRGNRRSLDPIRCRLYLLHRRRLS